MRRSTSGLTKSIKRFLKKHPVSKEKEFVFLDDNYYLIDRCTAGIGVLPGYSRLKETVLRYLIRNNYCYSKETLEGYIADKGAYVDISEAFELKNRLIYELVYEISAECESMNKGRKANAARMKNAVFSLRLAEMLDTDDIFEAMCSAEQTLCDYSPGYAQSDSASKNIIRAYTAKAVRKKRINLPEAAKKAADYAYSPSKVLLAVFFLATAVLTAAISVLAYRVMSLLFIASVLPIYDGVLSGVDFLLSHFWQALPPLRLDAKNIPEDTKTLVVITTLLFGKEKDSKVIKDIEEYYLKNKTVPGCRFGILADFPDAENRESSFDASCTEYISTEIERLNLLHNNRFCAFIRKRDRVPVDGRYGGRERKRGAVCDLVTLLCEENQGGFAICGCYDKNTKYLLTLDSDTVLPLDGVTELLAAAEHPYNRPTVRENNVEKGFGIFQPVMKTALDQSFRTYFSLLRSNGSLGYESAGYDRYQTLFGTGVFCGKGLINVPVFHAVAIPKTPAGRVLSHDIIEGSYLRCMAVSDLSFCDSVPKTCVSYYRRMHRWMRGDIQNVFVSGAGFSDRYGKLKILENIRRMLGTVSTAIGLAVFICLRSAHGASVLFLCFPIILPPVFGVISCFGRQAYTPRHFFTFTVNSFALNLFNLFYSVSAVFEEAAVIVDAAIRSLYRMLFSKRFLLEWVTFSQTEGESTDTLSCNIRSFITSAFIGTLSIAFGSSAITRLLGLAWFLFPVTAYVLSRHIQKKPHANDESHIEKCTEYARKTALFFEECVDKKGHYLPPDNIRISPSESIAYRTSPTNIGFYFISLLAMCDFGIITPSELEARTARTLVTVEGLEKYRGHLFNWYDTKTQKPIGGRYISTVDSGNLVTMLVCTANGLEEYAKSAPGLFELAKRMRNLIKQTDFSFLYSEKRGLLYLGCFADSESTGDICYDMLMSEIRTTCYYCCAQGLIPKRMWQSLSRAMVRDNGFMGIVSWSGSAFEYFMPELFLMSQKNSVIDESMQFAFSCQRRHRKNGLFGVSESGFYSFDAEMNYQYKAHGVPVLALKKYAEKDFVVSPYSSFLMLGEGPSTCLKNLSLLEKEGMYGKYGFYEAYDLSDGENIVYSYMSHHMGMTMAALANFCFDSVFVRRFMKEPCLYASRELLAESIPKTAYITPGLQDRIKKEQPDKRLNLTVQSSPSLSDPQAAAVNSGSLTLLATSSGHIAMRYGEQWISNTSFDRFSASATVGFTFFDRNESVPFTPLDGNGRFTFEKNNRRFSFISSSSKLPASVTGFVLKTDNTFAFKVKLPSESGVSVGFSFVPVLDYPEKYLSHRAFSALFIYSQYDEKEKVLLFFRKSDHKTPVCAVGLADKETDFEFTSSFEYMDASSHLTSSDFFNKPLENRVGDCINPLCAIKTQPVSDCVFLVSCGESRKDCLEKIKNARKRRFLPSGGEARSSITEIMLTSSLFGGSFFKSVMYDSSVLWKYSVSGDYPLFVLDMYEETKLVSEMLKGFVCLANCFIRTELVFIVHERENYLSPLDTFVREACTANQCSQYIGVKGGIFIINSGNAENHELDFIRGYACFCTESDSLTDTGKPSPYVKPPEIIRSGPAYDHDSPVNGISVSSNQPHPLPRAYVTAGRAAGAVVTESTLGFAYAWNAGENRISDFSTDPYAANSGISIYVFTKTGIYDAAAVSGKVLYSEGYAEYTGAIDSHSYTLTVFASARLPTIFYKLCFTDGFEARVAMAVTVRGSYGVTDTENGFYYKKLKRGAVKSTAFFIKNEKCQKHRSFESLFFGKEGDPSGMLALSGTGDAHLFVLGAVKQVTSAAELLDFADFNTEKTIAAEFVKRHIPPISVQSANGSFDKLFNQFAPYQTVFSRFFGKTGFYQTGGAFGFRDQLQDCLCLVYSDTRLVRNHIIRCAAHQYTEGDVMHWWFSSPDGDVGIRTKCSDDFLFLPYVVADYIKKTGDTRILDVRVHYKSSALPEKGERFEIPERSGICESVYLHCIRALANGERFGSHGISLMGSCDWNDGFSAVGREGKGESVFTSWFYLLTLKEFLPIMKLRGDLQSASHFAKISSELFINVEKHCFFGDRYARAFTDDGHILGVEDSEECKIDILSQAFAAIVCGENDRTRLAMTTAYNRLFDRESGLLKLFTPALDKINAGYISGYCKGIRENGGQYTHGALWGVMGFIRCGMYREAKEVLDSIMPYGHKNTEIYKVEDYVISADIYSGKNAGRGGWSWYTGSSGWFYKIVLEELFGVELFDGFRYISVKPKTDFSLCIKKNNYTLNIHASVLAYSVLLDGDEVTFPLEIPAGVHKLELPVISKQ